LPSFSTKERQEEAGHRGAEALAWQPPAVRRQQRQHAKLVHAEAQAHVVLEEPAPEAALVSLEARQLLRLEPRRALQREPLALREVLAQDEPEHEQLVVELELQPRAQLEPDEVQREQPSLPTLLAQHRPPSQFVHEIAHLRRCLSEELRHRQQRELPLPGQLPPTQLGRLLSLREQPRAVQKPTI